MGTQTSLYTLHIQLEPLHFDPPIWRRIQVTGDCTLRKLHHFIQAAFGWATRTANHCTSFSQTTRTRPSASSLPSIDPTRRCGRTTSQRGNHHEMPHLQAR